MNGVFDVVLTPLEWLGTSWALILASGVFGIVALICFKFISYQRGIKASKDKIKGHMIAIRIYQDDLVVVFKSVIKVLLRNLQYLSLNFGPFVPLAIPFVFVVAQFVTRYSFDGIPVETIDSKVLAGHGTELSVEFSADRRSAAKGLSIELPDGLVALSGLVRDGQNGVAFMEVAATKPGVHEVEFVLADGTRETKLLVAGEATRTMQPERVKSVFASLLWPAEPSFASDSAFERISFVYPDSDLGWLPGGVGGVLLVFLIASMAFGILILKPLGIQI
jgi:hypothetical protein